MVDESPSIVIWQRPAPMFGWDRFMSASIFIINFTSNPSNNKSSSSWLNHKTIHGPNAAPMSAGFLKMWWEVGWMLRREETFVDVKCTYTNAQKWPAFTSVSSSPCSSLEALSHCIPRLSRSSNVTPHFGFSSQTKSTANIRILVNHKNTWDSKWWPFILHRSSLLLDLISQTLPHLLWLGYFLLFLPRFFFMLNKKALSAS